MSSVTGVAAALDDLYRVEGKAELINDYGDAAEAEIAAKRADYFEAGTTVVWDVDRVHDLIRKNRRDSPDQPELFVRGQAADAEPAVPNWRMPVDRIFA